MRVTDPIALDREIHETVDRWYKQAGKLVGRRVRIVSPYNGQPYGRSKPSLQGQTHTIEAVSVDDYHGLCFWIEGHLYGCMPLTLKDVEFV